MSSHFLVGLVEMGGRCASDKVRYVTPFPDRFRTLEAQEVTRENHPPDVWRG